MSRLWAPWRATYILGPKEEGCLLCRISQQKRDRENLVLWRGRLCLVMLNRYPYNSGHLMVVPHRHEKDLEGLDDGEAMEMMELARKSIITLKNAMKPQGFNLGINLGDIAGAGVAGHVHLHIVPRWKGDTNFMPVAADTKVISQGLDETFNTLRKAWSQQHEETNPNGKTVG
jgi:ATP adenylyltransferase